GLCMLGACSGSVVDVAASATGSSADSGSGGTTAGAGGESSNGGAGQGGSPAACHKAFGDCKSVILDLRAKLAQARACDPASPVPQCQETVPGPCCPEVVADANSPETKCYLDTLAELSGSTCVEPCPPARALHRATCARARWGALP